MNNNARDRILDRLRAADTHTGPFHFKDVCMPAATYDRIEKVNRLKSLMEAVHTEVHVTGKDDWVGTLKGILRQRNLKSLLYAPQSDIAPAIEKGWESETDELPGLTVYDGPIEVYKDELFQVDAAITTTVGAIAETGAVILWPTATEPRLMSLVPPIHIAVVAEENIYSNFCEVIQEENWPDKMPTNALLISGPSKTADIELTLAFGVHGPKELIVLILTDSK